MAHAVKSPAALSRAARQLLVKITALEARHPPAIAVLDDLAAQFLRAAGQPPGAARATPVRGRPDKRRRR